MISVTFPKASHPVIRPAKVQDLVSFVMYRRVAYHLHKTGL